MLHWLVAQRTVQREDVISRFDPRFWTINFPRPMMAAVTTTAPDALRVDAVFYTAADLAGLIWEAEDGIDHPLLRYATARDFRRCRLSFRWRSAGLLPLDAVNGPTLTIEGRDAAGIARSWYVRLWNYATGTAEDAQVTLDFAAVDGGFLLPGEADPVWAGDVDRMFVSLVAPGFTGVDTPIAAPAEGWVELSDIVCEGPDAVLTISDAVLPEHRLSIATGYDDSYNLTPARVLRNALHLGYRGTINHYVGMSHYFRLEQSGDGWLAGSASGALNVAAAAWHRDFAVQAATFGYELIWSLSYELLDQHCPDAWKQRTADGAAAQTLWVPPSTLLSPAHDGATAYLCAVAAALMTIAVGAGLTPRFQVGEPWWWTMPDGRPCLYDAAAVAAFAPAPIASVRGTLAADQAATLDRAGACLAASTAALVAAAKVAAPGCVTHLLVYLPTVLDPAAPDVRRANLPLGWASPAFDVLQLEDYDWVTAGDTAATRAASELAGALLGYPSARQHYFAGFVAQPGNAATQWPLIEAAAAAAEERGVERVFLWALPQVMRDGLVRWDGEDAMDAFDDVLFPLALGKQAEVTPGFSTAILISAGGAEQRVASWAEARTSYDVGPGVRSAKDIQTLLAFFRARMGPARAFRLRDPFDSEGVGELLGEGDGTTLRFALVRHYGEAVRRITRPVAGTVTVAVAGAVTIAFTLEPGGWVVFDTPPPAGAAITADFTFDVPVRFAEDKLAVALSTFQAGNAAQVPLIEVREA